jgi:hypothetical protein
MSEEKQVLADSQTAEAINAATVAAEAAQKAQAAQMEAAFESAMTRFFNRGVSDKKFIDISRVPFLCDAVKNIDKTLIDLNEAQAEQSRDALWTKRIMIGVATFSGIVGLPLLSWMLISIIKSQTAIAVLQHAAH